MAEQKIYGLMSDNGDGSSSINWFKNKQLVDKILDPDYYPEAWGCNEGSPAETLTFPDDLNLEECGFVFCDEDYEEVDFDEL